LIDLWSWLSRAAEQQIWRGLANAGPSRRPSYVSATPVALDRLGRTGYYDLCMRDTDVADVWRHMFQSCPDAPEYVSRQLDCARSRASEQGVADIREIDADGEGILRSDRKSGRLNLFVRDGVVVAAAWC
jgi:hypothetical protein